MRRIGYLISCETSSFGWRQTSRCGKLHGASPLCTPPGFSFGTDRPVADVSVFVEGVTSV